MSQQKRRRLPDDDATRPSPITQLVDVIRNADFTSLRRDIGEHLTKSREINSNHVKDMAGLRKDMNTMMEKVYIWRAQMNVEENRNESSRKKAQPLENHFMTFRKFCEVHGLDAETQLNDVLVSLRHIACSTGGQ